MTQEVNAPAAGWNPRHSVHFPNMNDPTYKQIVPFLLEHFPEFKETDDYKRYDKQDLGLPYIVWADFTRYVLERLENNGAEDAVVQRLFNVVNEQFDNSGSDPQVINLLSVEVFEQFAQQKDSLEFARQHTHEKARHQLELVLAYTGVERPDLSIAPEAQETMDNIKKFNEGKWTPKPKEDK
jgi:hypothetical protein